MVKAYLGIDLGTSSVKALLLGEHGTVLGDGSAALTFSMPQPGYAEQSPADWWNATIAAVRQAVAACESPPEIGGVGVSGQMLGSVLIDVDGSAADSCIIWMDQRASAERDFVEDTLGIDDILDRTANYPLVSYWAPKLLWLRRNRPSDMEKVRHVLFPKDYLKYRLTSVYDIDVTDATGSMLFNTSRRKWDDSMFERLQIPREWVPAHASESTDIIGIVTKQASEALGIPSGIPVVGGGDQMCGAVGLGVVKAGIIASTIGTSGCVFSQSDVCVTDREPRALLSYCHSVPGSWCIYGCTLSAGGAYQWLRNTFFNNDKVTWDTSGLKHYAFMDGCAAMAAPGCEGLIFLPYLTGERTPHPDPNARGVFFGLSQRHGISEICRSVMEGVVFSLRDTVEIFRSHGVPVTSVQAAGGGAASPLWRQMQADMFGAQVLTTDVQEAPAMGAAILAAVGCSAYNTVAEASSDMVRIVSTTDPDPGTAQLYNDYYETYRALYPALRGLYASQSEKTERWMA